MKHLFPSLAWLNSNQARVLGCSPLMLSRFLMVLALGLVMTSASPALAQTGYYTALRQELTGRGLPAGTFLYGEDEQTVLNKFSLVGKIDGDQASQVTVTGKEFTKAVRLINSTNRAYEWYLNWTAYTDRDIKKNDALLLVLNVRTITVKSETGLGLGRVVGKPHLDGGGSFSAGSNWRRVYFAFKATEDIPAGTNPTTQGEKARIECFIGRPEQTLELGGVALINYGALPEDRLTSLSDLSFNYEGREANAAWRAAADQRIDQLRKSNLKVVVKDRNGNPIPGATVQVKMKRHAFPFGSAVVAEEINLNDTYRRKIVENFSAVSFENDLKWAPWSGAWGSGTGEAQALKAFTWLEANKLPVRGHALVFGGGNSPDMSNKSALAIYNETETHIKEIVGKLKGRLYEWDVANESTKANNNLVTGVQAYKPGYSSLVDWFNLARQADPAAKLVYNDYNILYGGEQENNVFELVKYLKDNKAPVDAVGEQGHFSTSGLYSIPFILERLDKFKAALNLPLRITEYDLGNYEIWEPAKASTLAERNAQADFTRDYYTALFSHPNTEGIQMWGFWTKRHWRPSSAMYDDNWNITPLGQAYQDLVLKKWWTNASGTTNAQGECLVRGFKGDYELEVSQGPVRQTVSFSLREDATVVVNTDFTALKTAEPVAARPTLYPNPAHQHFTISHLGNRTPQGARVIISNQLGAVVYNQTSTADPVTQALTIPTAGLPNGCYQVQVISGNEYQVHRLIISK